MEEKIFLVQRHDNYDDDTTFASIMTESELINYINMSDCFDEQYEIYLISTFGVVEKCHYVGWQPGCLIEIVNSSNEIIARGYGTDH